MLFDQNINREQWYGNQSFLPIPSLEKKHYVNNTIRFIEFGLDSSDFYTYPKSLNLEAPSRKSFLIIWLIITK